MKISIAVAGGGLLETYRRWLIPLFKCEHSVVPLSPKGTLDQIGDLLFSINFLPQLAQLAKHHHIPYLC